MLTTGSCTVRVRVASDQVMDPVRVLWGDCGMGQLHQHLLLGHLHKIHQIELGLSYPLTLGS